MAKNCYCDWSLVWWWFWIFGFGSDYVLSKIFRSGSDSDTIEIFRSGSDYQILISAQHCCRYWLGLSQIRGDRSQFFRLRLRSCSRTFETGSQSGSGNFSNFRIRTTVQTPAAIDRTKNYPCFSLGNDHAMHTPATAEIKKWLQIHFYIDFWLRVGIRIRMRNP